MRVFARHLEVLRARFTAQLHVIKRYLLARCLRGAGELGVVRASCSNNIAKDQVSHVDEVFRVLPAPQRTIGV